MRRWSKKARVSSACWSESTMRLFTGEVEGITTEENSTIISFSNLSRSF